MRIPLPQSLRACLYTLACGFLLAVGAAAADPPATAPAYATEEEWIVDSVARDVLAYAAYAAQGAAGRWQEPLLRVKTEGAAFQLTWKMNPAAAEQTARLAVPVCVWLPETYTAWAAQLLPAKGKPAAKSAPPSTLLEALLTPTAAVQQKENVRISQWLTREPANAAAHEEAALLLASVGVRERAGRWSDRRRVISRTTAQLALASALRGAGERTDAGRVAELWLQVTLQRKADADRLSAALRPNRSKAVQSWLNALEQLSTGDWRKAKDFAHASVLEQQCFIENLAYNTTVARAVAFLATMPKLAETPDPIRTCLNRDFHVNAGHVLADPALDLEFAEMRILSGGQRDADLVRWLNLPPGLPVAADAAGRPAVSVIDPGTWGRYSQRHLLFTTSEVARFYRIVGATQIRRTFLESAEPLVSKLTLGATLGRVQPLDQGSYEQAMKQLGPLSREHPEWLPPGLWSFAFQPPSKPLTAVTTMADPDAWFSPPVPRGCAQSSGTRLTLLSAHNVAWLEAQLALNPCEDAIALELVKWRNDDAAAAVKTFGMLNDYALPVMNAVAELLRQDPLAYRKQMDKVCQVDPAAFMVLGRYLVEHQQNEEAAAMFEKGVAQAPDTVTMSNQCRWLVNYYFEKGKKKEALALATMAYATGSTYGVPTLGWLLEQMGELDKAYAIFKQRYEDFNHKYSYDLATFCGRHRDDPTHPEYKRFYEQELPTHLTKGVETVTLESFKGRPEFAAVPTEPIPSDLLKAGLHEKGSIVAVNGIRVTSYKKFEFLRDSAPGASIEIIIHQDRKYTKATIPTRPPLLKGFVD